MRYHHMDSIDYTIDSVIEDGLVTSVTFISTREDSKGMAVTIEQACDNVVLVHTDDYLALTFVHARNITNRYSALDALEHAMFRDMLELAHITDEYIRLHKYVRLIEDIKG